MLVYVFCEYSTYPGNQLPFRFLLLMYQITAASITIITINNTVTGTTVLAMMAPPPSPDLDSSVGARKHH